MVACWQERCDRVLMALFTANAGGAWDNAKKAIEQDHIEGASSDEVTPQLRSETRSDPFKDTSDHR